MFTYLHSSGRYDRSAASVNADLADWEYDGTISLETYTEFSTSVRLSALVDKGWAIFNGSEKAGADDCVIRWRTDTWSLEATDSAVVSTGKSWRTSGAPIPPQYVTSVLLRHKATGDTLLVSVSHLPSHVEVAGGLRKSNRSVKWRDAVKNWKRHLRSLNRKWKPTARIVVADWNVNLRAPWFRQFLQTTFPAMHSAWVDRFPKAGTHGRRIIDVPLISRRLKVTRPPALLRTRSSDHTAFRVGLDWTRPIR